MSVYRSVKSTKSVYQQRVAGFYPSKLQAGVQCDERHNFRFFKILLKCLKYFNKLNVTARIKIGQRVNQNRFTYLDRELDNQKIKIAFLCRPRQNSFCQFLPGLFVENDGILYFYKLFNQQLLAELSVGLHRTAGGL